jgi:hypothetical protein
MSEAYKRNVKILRSSALKLYDVLLQVYTT